MRRQVWIAMTFLVTLTAGCRLGPPMLRATRSEYNRAVQMSNEEQLLLNLVRMKYRESPLFLDVGSVSAQFNIRKGANFSGRYSNEPTADAGLLGLGTDVSIEERPTITYTPLQGNAYAESLMKPLDLNKIMLLFYSGWRIDRIVRLTVQQINNVQNAVRAAGPTPNTAPVYEDFQELAKAMGDLQVRGLIKLGYESRQETILTSMPAQVVTVADVLDADQKKYRIDKVESAGTYNIMKSVSVPVLRVSTYGVSASEQDGRFARILGVAQGMHQYDIREAFSARGEGDNFQYNELAFGMRSLMGAMFYLSQGVEIPEEHVERGLVTVTLNEDGSVFDWTKVTGDLMSIHTSPMEPADTTLKVKHRGHWFYISENDLTSKSTLVLLLQLLALQAGGAEVEAPVLTLPLGG